MEITETQTALEPERTPSPPAPPGTVARNAFNLLLGQLATTAIAIALSAVLGRSLGAHGYGIYYLITTFSTFAYVFVEWGQPLLVIRCVATEPGRAPELLGTALVMRIGTAIAVLLPVALIAWLLGYDLRTSLMCLALIVGTLPFFLAQGFGMVFRGRDQMGLDAIVSVLFKALSLALVFPVLRLGLEIPGVIAAQLAAGLASLAVAFWLYRRLREPRLRFSFATVREILLRGAPILAMTGAISAQPYLDAVILSKLAPAVVVGWFGAARNILGTLMAPATILGAAAYPRLARASAESPAALHTEVATALRTMLWLGALGATGTYLFAHVGVELIYGRTAFGPAATVLEVFAPGMLLLFIDILLGNIAYACGKGREFAVAKIASVVASSALDLVFIPFFQARTGNGGIGVLVSFALSELLVFAGALRSVPRGALGKGMWLDLGRALATGGVTVLVCRTVSFLPPYLGIPLCVAVFAATSLAVGLARKSDLQVVRSLVSRKK